MKTLALIFVLALFGLACANTENKQAIKPSLDEDWHFDLMEGECGDVSQYKVLISKHVSKGASNFHHQTDEVEYIGDDTVRCVIVQNLRTDGHGGSVAIADGGVLQHSMKLVFKSKLSRGMEFQADIYGN